MDFTLWACQKPTLPPILWLVYYTGSTWDGHSPMTVIWRDKPHSGRTLWKTHDSE